MAKVGEVDRGLEALFFLLRFHRIAADRSPIAGAAIEVPECCAAPRSSSHIVWRATVTTKPNFAALDFDRGSNGAPGQAPRRSRYTLQSIPTCCVKRVSHLRCLITDRPPSEAHYRDDIAGGLESINVTYPQQANEIAWGKHMRRLWNILLYAYGWTVIWGTELSNARLTGACNSGR
jgi:hypothetical protein